MSDLISERLTTLRETLGQSMTDGLYFEPVALAALCAVLEGLSQDAAALERIIDSAVRNVAGPDARTGNVLALAILLDAKGVTVGLGDGAESGR